MTMTRDELLAAYASGATSPGLSLLCAAHLTLSPQGRDYVGALEEIGGAMLCEEPLQELDAPGEMSFEDLLQRIDAEDSAPQGRTHLTATEDLEAGPLPRPVAQAVGKPFSQLPWRKRLRAISEYVISEIDGEKVSLLRANPGARVPDHTHRGVEATLILTGAMQDGDRTLTSGDIALCGPEHDHHPEIVGDETCYCLVVVDGKLRFTGRFGPALNLFAE